MQVHRFAWQLAFTFLLTATGGAASARIPWAGTDRIRPAIAQGQINLSPAEQLAQADAFIGRMVLTGAAVRRHLQDARAQHDRVKTICLSDKLNQVDVAIRSARDHRKAIEQAMTHRDIDDANLAFSMLLLLRQRVEQLGVEANQCVGSVGPCRDS
jgi:hypothetical protein